MGEEKTTECCCCKRRDDVNSASIFPAGLTMCIVGYALFFRSLLFWLICGSFILFGWIITNIIDED